MAMAKGALTPFRPTLFYAYRNFMPQQDN